MFTGGTIEGVFTLEFLEEVLSSLLKTPVSKKSIYVFRQGETNLTLSISRLHSASFGLQANIASKSLERIDAVEQELAQIVEKTDKGFRIYFDNQKSALLFLFGTENALFQIEENLEIDVRMAGEALLNLMENTDTVLPPYVSGVFFYSFLFYQILVAKFGHWDLAFNFKNLSPLEIGSFLIFIFGQFFYRLGKQKSVKVFKGNLPNDVLSLRRRKHVFWIGIFILFLFSFFTSWRLV